MKEMSSVLTPGGFATMGFGAPAAISSSTCSSRRVSASARPATPTAAAASDVGAQARAAALGTRSIKTTAKAWALDLAIRSIDLTTLEGADTPGAVRSLCAKAVRPDPADPACPPVAAVCIYNDLVPVAVEALRASGNSGRSVRNTLWPGR